MAPIEGLSRFWTRDVKGDRRREQLGVLFGQAEPSAVMEVVDLVPDTRVAWRCVEGPDEWVGTNLTFELRSSGDETIVLFTHAGWKAGRVHAPLQHQVGLLSPRPEAVARRRGLALPRRHGDQQMALMTGGRG